ncbi:MAG: ATP-binding protein [Clostridia bacterium]|nr:ATP-binding protein [Clostridia bacterium]
MKKNKRTLKKRVRKIIAFCVFLTVVLFSGAVIYGTMHMVKMEGDFLSQQISRGIAMEMNSSYFLRSMGIKSLEEFNPESTFAEEWLENIRKREKDTYIEEIGINAGFDNREEKNLATSRDLESVIYTRIVINNRIVYLNGKFNDNKNTQNIEAEHDLLSKIYRYFINTQTTNDLINSSGKKIGEVTVMISSDLLFMQAILIISGIIFLGMVMIGVANLIGKILTISVSKPLEQLNYKIDALAHEDFESCINKQIVLKKPLREIENLADSTNLIMYKMKEYKNILMQQKGELVEKNEELEAQNDELIRSRTQIEEQKCVLEQQNEELEAQNIELFESKKKIEETQTLLVQSENMASVGQLTAAITHEINTPLGAIMSNVQICDMLTKMLNSNETVNSNEELKELMEQMKEANSVSIMGCKRVIEIIKSLKTFSKIDQAEFQQVNIVEGIQSVLILTSNLWKNKIKIYEEYGEIPHVKCFPGLLNQVFMNIITNAIQAIENSGEIYIKTYKDDKNVYVSIRDTGSGIREEHLERIFDSGFTTKNTGVGMGIGLKICQNIIQKHNGEIIVRSDWGKGTEFIITVPLEV